MYAIRSYYGVLYIAGALFALTLESIHIPPLAFALA